jgi:hypothetical protein
MSFPRKQESRREWIPDQVGDDKKRHGDGRKSTDMIVELSFPNVSIGNPEPS